MTKGLISEGFTTVRLYYLVQSKVLIDSTARLVRCVASFNRPTLNRLDAGC